MCLPVRDAPGECYYNTLLCCDDFSSSSVVSRAFSVLRVYLKFGLGHPPHPLGYLCAKFRFFCGLHCWAASPLRKIAYSINHSPSSFNVPWTEALRNKWIKLKWRWWWEHDSKWTHGIVNLYMSVNQHVNLEVIVVFAERIQHCFSDLEQPANTIVNNPLTVHHLHIETITKIRGVTLGWMVGVPKFSALDQPVWIDVSVGISVQML